MEHTVCLMAKWMSIYHMIFDSWVEMTLDFSQKAVAEAQVEKKISDRGSDSVSPSSVIKCISFFLLPKSVLRFEPWCHIEENDPCLSIVMNWSISLDLSTVLKMFPSHAETKVASSGSAAISG